ncbi:MAG: TIGR03986 family CRISPR-associated RAMP protein [Neomegalonema sp.]|nr:TIGR03986 family CRISPR-associated RAMP protein [Neomegalonema sp.]
MNDPRKKRFHNPYNFIPFRGWSDQSNSEEENGLGEGAPLGHDRYHKDTWSGRIEVEIEAATPLLLPDTSQTTFGDKNHATHPKVMRDPRPGRNDCPMLRPSSLKGALRSAYEAITLSRMGVFAGHYEPLGRRDTASDGLNKLPIRILECELDLSEGPDNGSRLKFEFFLGTDNSTISKDSKLPASSTGPLWAAWVPQYDTNGGTSDRGPVYRKGVTDNNRLRHGEPYTARLQKVRHHTWDKKDRRHKTNTFEYWSVIDLKSGFLDPNECDSWNQPRETGKVPDGQNFHEALTDDCFAHGYGCVTGQNFSKKHDERLFFVKATGAKPDVPTVEILGAAARRLIKRYQALILDYQEIHRQDIAVRLSKKKTADAFLGKAPGKPAWSRHVHTRDDATLKPNDILYAVVESNEPDAPHGVTDLVPVLLTRKLDDVSPADLLPDAYRTARKLVELTPADRVFGWVAQRGAEAKERGGNTHKGQLRIVDVSCDTEGAIETFAPPIPLAILGQPKPNQGRFYLGTKRHGWVRAQDAGAGSEYKKGKHLRGPKVYPHHNIPQTDYWSAEQVRNADERKNCDAPDGESGRPREFLRWGGEQDSQNRSIGEWVKPKTKFRATLEVTNLNPAELGALLWLLDMNAFAGGNRPAHLRLGGGKPLGFGSVKVSLTGVDLRDGGAKRSEYADAFGGSEDAGGATICWDRKPEAAMPEEGATTAATLVETFREASRALCGGADRAEDLPHLASFLVAARGHDDGLGIHYPRVANGNGTWNEPDPKGENFKWFGENEKRQKKSLPDLVAAENNPTEGNEVALPFYPPDNSRRRRR